MKKMPAILPNYKWDVDRTGDIIAVRVIHRGVTVGYYCYAVTPTIALRLRLAFLHALWDEFVVGPIFHWVNVFKDWQESRADRIARKNEELAIYLNGQWDWRGSRIPEHN